MSKIALINDTHMGARSDSDVFLKYFAKFFDDVFFPTLKARGIKSIIHLGDLMDRRKYSNHKTIRYTREHLFRPIVDNDLTMHLILGNHDIYYKDDSWINSPSELFPDIPNLVTYTQPGDQEIEGMKLAMVPWINRGNYDDTMSFLKKTDARVLMGHLEITGFDVLRGITCRSGQDKSEFNAFELVLLGHFHQKQQKGHIYYLGTQYQITFSDLDEPKGFHIFDTETLELEWIENPSCMFHKIKYNDSENDYKPQDMDFSEYENAYVKLIVEKKTSPYTFDRFVSSLYDVGVANLSIIEDTEFYSVDDGDILDISQDTPTLINKEIDSMDDVEKPEVLKSLVHEIYLEALNQ